METEKNVTVKEVAADSICQNVDNKVPQFTACSDGTLCEIEATVVSGFEPMAKEEVEEKLGVIAQTTRGRVNMSIPIEDVTKVLSLRSVDNVLLVVNRCSNFPFSDSLDMAMDQVRAIVPQVDWTNALQVWTKIFKFPHIISPVPKSDYGKTPELAPCTETIQLDSLLSSEQNSVPDKESVMAQNSALEGDVNVTELPPTKKTRPPKNPLLPSFRATCYRTGTRHCFQSPQAAIHFGGEIDNYFGWNVDLENFDIEVVLNIDDDNIRVCIALTKESLHRRDITKFGPTTLRPTIAYGMLRLCKIQEGEIVCDPMCGGGSIPVEAALNWPLAHHFCGDIYQDAPGRAMNNILSLNKKREKKELSPIVVDVFRWDACSLPLHDNSVDVFITDMPFGKRIGSRQSNWHLYPRLLTEWARVCKPETGRACLLTHDRKCISQSLNAVSHLWRRGPTVGVNIGGLAAAVYLLFRTTAAVHSRQSSSEADS